MSDVPRFTVLSLFNHIINILSLYHNNVMSILLEMRKSILLGRSIYMFCRFCGQESADGVKFCKRCGHALGTSPSQIGTGMNPGMNAGANPNVNTYTNPGQNMYGAPQPYQPGSVYSPPQSYQPANSSPYSYSYNQKQNTSSTALGVTVVCIVLAFLGIFFNWLSVKATYSGISSSKSLSFTEVFEKDEDVSGYNSRINNNLRGDYSNVYDSDDYDTCRNAYRVMKWCGLFGYIMLGVSVVLMFVNRKYLKMALLAASLLFVIAFIGMLIYNSKAEDITLDIMKKYIGSTKGLKVKLRVGFGMWLTLIFTIIACISSFSAVSKNNSSRSYF